MATKTVVCPECGASAAPGRYACAECGALLASVAVAARPIAPEPEPVTAEAEPAAVLPTAVAAPAVVVEPTAPEPLASVAGPVTPAVATEPRVATPKYAKLGRPRPVAPSPDLLPHAGASVPFDEDAPIGSMNGVAADDEPERFDDEILTIDERHVPDQAVEPRVAHIAHGAGATPGWPPVGDRGVVDRPESGPRAGSYLPPSAINQAFAAASVVGAMAAAPPLAPAAAGASGEVRPSLTERVSGTLGDVFDNVRVPGDLARRTIMVGSALASIGLLLPWLNGPAGQSPLAGYLDRWGLAGPGMWLVLLGLVGLAVVAASAGRPASWPIGLPSVALAAFLGGLLWPYVVGGFGRSIGIWLVLVGAVVLAVGGLLDRRVRHAGIEPVVPTPDAEGR